MDENPTQELFGTIFLRDLTKIDCALFDPSKGIYGQTWELDVHVSGPLGENRFVCDFSLLKTLIRQTLKNSIDHALVIPINSQSVLFQGREDCESWRMRSRLSKSTQDVEWEYKSPVGAVYPARSVALTRPLLEQEICRTLRHRLPQQVAQVSVQLREEEAEPTEAVFRYTHGIAGHEGLCQRLFHGHRSRLQVFVGEERRPDLEHFVVRDVLGTHVHIATPSQVKSGPDIRPGTRGTSREPLKLGYKASLGTYEATLPADRVFMVEHETSIECITTELARLIKREDNTSEKVRVVCFEGINKGAVCEL